MRTYLERCFTTEKQGVGGGGDTVDGSAYFLLTDLKNSDCNGWMDKA